MDKDPNEKLKIKANKIITSVNDAQSDIKLDKLVKGFKPGYLYSTVKKHINLVTN